MKIYKLGEEVLRKKCVPVEPEEINDEIFSYAEGAGTKLGTGGMITKLKAAKIANDNGIPFVAIIGETELANGTIMLKDMNLGTQQPLTIDEVIEKLK